ncbi:hypothetical protein AMJ85_10670 [candidate division BRC1 bacterium SM23_51]|nr:MAG: hypothetical protein AMJ85_10670 [candidate division BRC1 bacterium SM23_51]
MQVSVSSILSVLFFAARDIPNKAEFVSNFLEYTKVFDADPMILPIRNAPPPVPRITMKSRDGRYVCEVGLDRLSFAHHDVGKQKPTLDDLYPKYRDTLHHVILGTLAGIASPIVRLGFVTRHLVELGEGANEWLRQTYLRTDRLPGAYETHLNMLHRIELESFRANRWIKVWTLRDQQHPERDPAVAVEIDINTPPNEKRAFDRSAILAFFLDAFAQTEQDLKTFVLAFLETTHE